MLKHGLGRAVLCLRDEPDPAHFRYILRRACLEDWRYDSQIDERRAHYLFDVIQATQEPQFYVAVVRNALDTIATPQEAETASRSQVIALAALLTKSKDGDLRDALYWAIERAVREPDQAILSDIRDAVIEMDGIAGYRFLAEQWLRFPDDDEERWEDIFLLGKLYEQLGDATAAADALDALAQDAPHLASYITTSRRAWDGHNIAVNKAREQRQTAQSAAPTEAEIYAYINGAKRPKPRIHLVETELRERLAEELNQEADRERRLRYLRLLRSSAQPLAFPGDPQILLRFIRRDEDEQVAWHAALALEHTPHPEVRAAALEFLHTETRLEHGVRLLPINPGSEDLTLLTELLARDWEPDRFHHIGAGILKYVELHNDPELIPVMLLCYEKMACAFCRGLIVRELLKRDALPSSLRAECHYDANPDTRELVQS